MSMTASEARANLFGLIKQVNDDRNQVEIVSKAGSAVLVAKDEWDAIQETAYLLRSPVNFNRLNTAVADVESGHELRSVELDLDE
ncbi:antitoxin YefM [Promicromonospora umidemergens]|uniref:Antitoxin n=1 Tax=Promicromonospora umidemergens TaxID=629679 RepID=A0ABP8XWF1_9MICO|nr:type II toxin-antitoxin system prevent-host-death family antitoxin [Promicromonospora umidemergens]MCP2284304.1 antitoxin YefM [Promicromonospora umidemergens]